MHFELIGNIESQETFASGSAIRELDRLQKVYGKARWKKRKGQARIKLQDGSVRLAEVHWYEASSIGKKEIKIKCFLD